MTLHQLKWPLYSSPIRVLTQMWRPFNVKHLEKAKTNVASRQMRLFQRLFAFLPLFNMISPISYTQTLRDQPHTFDIYVFVLEGALRVRYFSVTEPERIDSSFFTAEILFTLCRGPSQMAPVLDLVPIYLLFQRGGRADMK